MCVLFTLPSTVYFVIQGYNNEIEKNILNHFIMDTEKVYN
jgi:hypothetical protein